MFLKNLRLTNFRNLTKANVEFAQGTLLIGNNAQGKSNLLEAIYVLATAKSLRAEKDIQIIKYGENFARIEGEVAEEFNQKDQEPIKLEIVMQKKEEAEGIEKRVKVNGVSRRIVDYIGNLIVVYFSPEDINLITGTPALRRAYLDLTLSQADREYKRALVIYSTALSSKNRVLKRIQEGLAKLSELDFWILQMVESGNMVSSKRRNFFKVVNQEKQSMGNFRFEYKENILSQERLVQYQSREIAAGASLIGPHRDDFMFEMNGRNLAFFGSRGEQRTAVLELKLVELQFIKQIKGALPVLLLDDVFSEMDALHREYVISTIYGQQTVLSVVETEQLPEDFLKRVKIIEVEKGEALTTET